MPMKGSGPATGWREIDRFENGARGAGWIAHPDERMQRASHALATDEGVYVVDPVDAEGIDDLLTEFGEVAGVVVLLDRHKRDAAAVARRHDVPVYVPDVMAGITDDLDAETTVVRHDLGGSGFAVHGIIDNPLWSEAALYNEDDGTLVVPEALGTCSYFLAGDERLGVHPALRMTPPKRLRRFGAERLLVGHGEGVLEDAASAIEDAVSGARSRAPRLYAQTLRSFLPV
ncbi:hypothetical protein [Salinirussus salinus]|uniref:hypothetical protein n=1 Tax=Salinirussus salinus TaxID=1198300 RepID=UPI00135B7C41|nr:hypothetical protein [Salinirussus salinus]